MSLLYPELSYKIVGAVYETYNELGYGYQEKYYYRGIAIRLEKAGLKVQKQLHSPILVEGKNIGKYFLDFLIADLVVLEIKVSNDVYPQHIKQVLGYLKANSLHLGIIAVITKKGVITKRVVA
jgi:GxxExxY protein